MILKATEIAKLLDQGISRTETGDPLVVAPCPDLEELKNSGSASIDLRLGTWFVLLREYRMTYLRIVDEKEKNEPEDELESGNGGKRPSEAWAEKPHTKHYYVPFGESFFLHPGCFALGVTLEWLRMPSGLAGYVVGRSSWGRRGLIIASAFGVHPGFTGCLTLELSNIGEIPIEIMPGLTICQLFIHRVEGEGAEGDKTPFIGQRRPMVSEIYLDSVAQKLKSAYRSSKGK